MRRLRRPSSWPATRCWRRRPIGSGPAWPKGRKATSPPTLTLLRPQKGRANGVAVVVVPVGAYISVAANLEGRQVADWFAARGITAFVLKYRVGPNAGVDAGRAADPDPVARASSRPDFLMLGYPWLEGTVVDAKGRSQYCTFSGRPCGLQDYARFVPLGLVGPAMPPTFLYHTVGDHLVPVEGTIRFAMALAANRVPFELHAIARGEHGSGLGGADAALAGWPDLLEEWLRGRGLLDPPGKAKP